MRPLPGWWARFWFAPTPTSTLAVVRIAYGAVLLAWTLSLSFDLTAFFSTSGVVPDRPRPPWTWSLFDLFPSDGAVLVVFGLLVAAAVCLLVGYRTRLAALVAMVCLLSFQARNPYALNSGDILLRVIGFYLVFAPAGAALSVDRWRLAPRSPWWAFPERAPWALRLIQLQLSAMYGFAVWAKLRGTTWNEGTAVSYALRLQDLVRIPVPPSITQSLAISNALTFGTLATEVALTTLVWNRRARPWVLALGVVMHVLIDLTITVGFFSFAVFVGYLAFVPAETMSRWLLAGRDRLRRSSLAPLRRVAGAGRDLPPPETDEVEPTDPGATDAEAPGVEAAEVVEQHR
ncbi:MAG: HTTM domain-containing protein [Acidimicrobiales bacterium]